MKVITALLGLAFITECLAYFMALKYRNNLAIYNISSIMQFFLVSLYFNFSIPKFRKRGLGILIGSSGLVLGALNLFLFQNINQIESYFLLLEGIATITMCLFAFAELMLEKRGNRSVLKKNAHFWIPVIFTFFWSATFLNWGLYDYINQVAADKVWLINVTLMMVNIVTYAGMGLILKVNKKP